MFLLVLSFCFIAKKWGENHLLSQDNSLSAVAFARGVGITSKAVEKHIAKMKEYSSVSNRIKETDRYFLQSGD